MTEDDRDFIKRVVTHPRNWPLVSSDGVRPEDYEPSSAWTYFRHADFGFVEIRPVMPHVVDCHVCMLPGATCVTEFCRGVMASLREQGVLKFMLSVPEGNRAARHLARRLGFEMEGRISRVLLRGGQMTDLLMYGAF